MNFTFNTITYNGQGIFTYGGKIKIPLPEVVGVLVTGGSLSASLENLSPEVTGIIKNSAMLSVLIAPKVEVTGICLSGNIGSADLVIPVPIVNSYSIKPITSSGAVIAPSSEAYGRFITILTGGVKAQPATTQGILLTGSIGVGYVTAPNPIVKNKTGFNGQLIQSIAEVNGSCLVGNILAADIKNIKSIILGNCINHTLITGNINLPKPSIQAELLAGSVSRINATIATALLRGKAISGRLLTGNIIVPVQNISGNIGTGTSIIASIILPKAQVNGNILTIISSFIGWSMNTENQAITNYTNYPFHSLAKLGDQYLGASEDGIYLLEGADDAGVDILAEFKFGISDFGSEALKRLTGLYAGYRANGDMELRVKVDGEATEYTYPIVTRGTGIQSNRAKAGKGLKSRYWQLGFTNVDGSEFEFDSLDLMLQAIPRRLSNG